MACSSLYTGLLRIFILLAKQGYPNTYDAKSPLAFRYGEDSALRSKSDLTEHLDSGWRHDDVLDIAPHIPRSHLLHRLKWQLYRCNRLTYARLTVFQLAIYFSMHCEKQVCSLELNEEPGSGTHRSKQWSLIFYRPISRMFPPKGDNTYLYQHARIGDGSLLSDRLNDTSLGVGRRERHGWRVVAEGR